MVSGPGASSGEPDRLLTVREVARLLCIAPSTVYALCERNQLPHVRVANAIRIAPGDITAYLTRTRRNAAKRDGGGE